MIKRIVATAVLFVLMALSAPAASQATAVNWNSGPTKVAVNWNSGPARIAANWNSEPPHA